MRVPTGIKGFDDLIEGGFIPNSVNIIRGGPGTGKTLFSSQFLYTGATNFNEPGVYVSLEERVVDIKDDVKETFGWDLEALEKKGLLSFVPIRIRRVFHPIEKLKVLTMSMSDLSKKIIDAVDKAKAKRLVIDSISIVDMMFEDKFQVRADLVALTDGLREKGVTTVMIGESPEVGEEAKETFIGFVGDMVIKLDTMYIKNEFKRVLSITKMRRSNHSRFIHPYDITKDGLKLEQI